MKNSLFLAAGLVFLALGARAELTTETPISSPATFGSVSVSTSALTKINPSSPMAKRTGILVNQKANNTGIMYGVLGNCTSTTATISTGHVIEIGPTDRERLIPIDTNTCLWLYSGHTAAETIYYQEVSQRAP